MHNQDKKKNSGGRKFLLVLLIAVLLVGLFLASFTITSMILKNNHDTGAGEEEILDDGKNVSPTQKPTYEELESAVKAKDKKITELEAELEKYKSGDSSSSKSSSSVATKTPATKKPTAATAKPTPAPTAKPTPAPTVAPEAPVADTEQ